MSDEKWNQYNESLLKRWAEMSKMYSIMHSLCAQYYATWNKRLGVPIVVIGAVTASSIFSNNSDNASSAWTYANGALALTVTAMAGVSNFLGITEKTNKHQTASFKYMKIAMDIDTILSFDCIERGKSPQDFIQEIKTEILNVRENVPEILPWIMANYINKLDKAITDTTSSVNSARTCNHEKQHKLPSDFTDKISVAVLKASQKISQLHRGDSQSDRGSDQRDIEKGI